jgi:hypothetical protein
MTYPSADHSLNQHAAENYPSSSDGSIGSFWKEKQRRRIEEEAWINSLTDKQREVLANEAKQREEEYYLYNQ